MNTPKEIEAIQSNARNRFGDIPLKNAMIAWAPLSMTPDYWTPGAIVILPYDLDDGNDWVRHYRVSDTTGACWNTWDKWTTEQRLQSSTSKHGTSSAVTALTLDTSIPPFRSSRSIATHFPVKPFLEHPFNSNEH